MAGFESRHGLGIFLFATASRPALETPSLLSDGYHSPHVVPTSRMHGTIPPISQYAFMAWYFLLYQKNKVPWIFEDVFGDLRIDEHPFDVI